MPTIALDLHFTGIGAQLEVGGSVTYEKLPADLPHLPARVETARYFLGEAPRLVARLGGSWPRRGEEVWPRWMAYFVGPPALPRSTFWADAPWMEEALSELTRPPVWLGMRPLADAPTPANAARAATPSAAGSVPKTPLVTVAKTAPRPFLKPRLWLFPAALKTLPLEPFRLSPPAPAPGSPEWWQQQARLRLTLTAEPGLTLWPGELIDLPMP